MKTVPNWGRGGGGVFNSIEVGSARTEPAVARFESIDGLRGIAALAVALFHTTWPSHPTSTLLAQNGYAAVDLFFLISGFVIAASSSRRVRTVAGVRVFLLRRFFRLYPLHLAILLFLVAQECLKLLARCDIHADLCQRHAFTGPHSIKLLLAHFLLLQGSGLTPEVGWNVPSWTVSAEWIAYLLFAAAGLSGALRGGKGLAWIAGAGLAGYIALSHFFGALNLTADYGLLRCLFGFPIGVALYHFRSTYQAALAGLGGARASLLEGAALAAVLVVLALLKGGAVAWVIPCYAALLAIFHSQQGIFSRALLWPPLQWLGLVSYSVYLVHVPLRNLLSKALQSIGVPTLLTAGDRNFLDISRVEGDLLLAAYLLAILATAALTYRYIEEPARLLGRRLSARGGAETVDKPMTGARRAAPVAN
ncbi:MAG TPA: acyltransferase [Rhodoblastus sp.]|nr:acyltransferase [Rhodoblastus sp.]